MQAFIKCMWWHALYESLHRTQASKESYLLSIGQVSLSVQNPFSRHWWMRTVYLTVLMWLWPFFCIHCLKSKSIYHEINYIKRDCRVEGNINNEKLLYRMMQVHIKPHKWCLFSKWRRQLWWFPNCSCEFSQWELIICLCTLLKCPCTSHG